ncbi:MAG TPA: rhodanese-like domain-containing protein [Blastocatellia bacterium]|jgi:rhodanese-related sulfurtransferase|nr:rhodanese-like domain-containing protein [Blastocatellia bacterium]
MKISKWTGVLAAVLAACASTSLAFQRIDASSLKPPPKKDTLRPVGFITPENLKTKIAQNEAVVIVDVRGPNAYSQSEKTIKGALHSKLRRVAYRLRELPRDKEVVTYCACPDDEAAAIAARALLSNGFKSVLVLKGGWNAWLQAGGPVQPRPR